MPNISNPILSLQHGGAGTTRTARVNFTVSFTSLEVLAGEVFQADVSIKSDDGSSNIVVGTTFVQASSTPTPVSVSKTLTRMNLDEDPDFHVAHNGNVIIREDRDEWKAVITLSPVVFSTVTAQSPIVTGSWGARGND